MVQRTQIIVTIFLYLSWINCISQSSQCNGLAENIEIVNSYTLEDPQFVEGFFYDSDSDLIYESYGLYQHSGIRAYPLEDPITMENTQILYENPTDQFAEGLSKIGDVFYQLTYKEGIINTFHEEIDDTGNRQLVLDQQLALPRNQECIVPEGWGLTTDGERYLYMSDGSNSIYRFDPTNLSPFDQEEFEYAYAEGECSPDTQFEETYYIFNPEDPEVPLANLNELELVGDLLYVNILDFSVETFFIVEIQVTENSLTSTRMFDLCYLHELLCSEMENWEGAREFNGIAYHDPSGTFLLTGKEWPLIYSVDID